MNFRNSKLDEKYSNDPHFHRIVQMLYNAIAEHGTSPSELREACFLAHYKYEMENPRAMESRVLINMANFIGLEDKLNKDK